MHLILGGAGYIGSSYYWFLKKNNIAVKVIDDLSQGNSTLVSSDDLIISDYANKNILVELDKVYSIEYLYIFAAIANVPDSVSNPADYYNNNVSKLVSIMDFVNKSKIKYVFFASSAAVYGYYKSSCKINNPLNPINPYGNTKMVGEKIIIDYANSYNFKFSIIRFFNVAGVSKYSQFGELRKNESHLIPNLLKSIINDSVFYLYGNNYDTMDGTCLRDYIHIDDLLELIYLSMLHISESESTILNGGTSVKTSILQIIKTANKITNKITNIQIKERRNGDPDILFADISINKDLLGWEPIRTINDIVYDSYTWFNKIERNSNAIKKSDK